MQSVDSFTVGTGFAYQSIKVRAIDRCGNSALGDVLITPIPLCDLVLPVDTIQKDPAISNRLAKVFPNPSHNYFTIAISQRKKADYKIEITNSNGIKVYERSLYGVDKTNHNVQGIFIPGLYIISVTEMGSGRRSVFKQIMQ